MNMLNKLTAATTLTGLQAMLSSMLQDSKTQFDEAFASLRTRVVANIEGEFDDKDGSMKLMNKLPLMALGLQPGEAAATIAGKRHFILIGTESGLPHVIHLSRSNMLLVANAGHRLGDQSISERHHIHCTTEGPVQKLLDTVNGMLDAKPMSVFEIFREAAPEEANATVEAATVSSAAPADVTVTVAPAATAEAAPAGAPTTVSVTPVATVVDLGAAPASAELQELAGKGQAVVISRGEVHRPAQGPAPVVTRQGDNDDITH